MARIVFSKYLDFLKNLLIFDKPIVSVLMSLLINL